MELEQLKDMWKDQEAGQVSPEVQPLLGKKSNTPIAKMKRHLIVELIAVVVAYGFLVAYFASSQQGKFFSIAVLYFVLGFLFCVYFYKKFRLLNDMQCMACQVKTNLSKQVTTLEKYIRFYLVAGTAIIPIVFIFFYWFEYSHLRNARNHFFVMPSNSVSVLASLGYLLLWIIPFTVFFYFVNKWYVQKLYGRHVQSLKDMLAQMEDDAVYS